MITSASLLHLVRVLMAWWYDNASGWEAWVSATGPLAILAFRPRRLAGPISKGWLAGWLGGWAGGGESLDSLRPTPI